MNFYENREEWEKEAKSKTIEELLDFLCQNKVENRIGEIILEKLKAEKMNSGTRRKSEVLPALNEIINKIDDAKQRGACNELSDIADYLVNKLISIISVISVETHKWHKSSEKKPKTSTPMEINRVVVYTRLSDGTYDWTIGWYIEALDEWRVFGSPTRYTDKDITHWMEIDVNDRLNGN